MAIEQNRDDEIKDWLDRYLDENLSFNGFPQEPGPDTEAVLMSEQCVEAAKEQGYTRGDLERVSGFLAGYIHDRMVRLADRHLAEQVRKDD